MGPGDFAKPTFSENNFRFLGNDQFAILGTPSVIDIDSDICSFVRKKEIFDHTNWHGSLLGAYQANLLVKWNHHVEARVIDYGAHRCDMYLIARP